MVTVTVIGAFAFNALGAASVKGSEVAEFASKYEGCGYQYASKGPDKFDCSGFVYYVLGNFGITFGNSTSEYNTKEKAASFGTVIEDMADAKEGDIVVWSSHAAVYLGDGECIAAMNPKKGVCINEVEKFVDKNDVKNPPHFFIRPDSYIEETEETETAPAETEAVAEESVPERISFKERIKNMFETILKFLKAPFEPVVNMFK